MSKVQLISGVSNIRSAIADISKRGRKLDMDIHAVACSCLHHADLHGDVTLANKLLEHMPKSARKNALIDWFQAFGKFAWNDESKVLVFNRLTVSRLNKAMDKPFWEFKPEPAYKPFDLQAEIGKLLAAADKRISKADTRDTIDMSAYAKLKDLAVAHNVVTMQ